ncbi:MAG: hypothetical protein QXI16_00750 [Sulfolobaceae archaeon]
MDIDEKVILEKNFLDSYITAKYNELSKPLEIEITRLKSRVDEITDKINMVYKVTVGIFIGVSTLIVFNIIKLVH